MPIYSYAELKGKIKVGDKVRAVVGKENGCARLKDDGSNTIEITKVLESIFSIDGCTHPYDMDSFLELLTEEKTLDNVDVGDVVVSGFENQFTILDTSKNGVILFMSAANDPDSDRKPDTHYTDELRSHRTASRSFLCIEDKEQLNRIETMLVNLTKICK